MRLEGIPILSLWEVILDVFSDRSSAVSDHQAGKQKVFSQDPLLQALSTIDKVPPNIPRSSGRGKLVIFEDNDGVIKMCIKGRSDALRHLHRTHRIAADWVYTLFQEEWVFSRP